MAGEYVVGDGRPSGIFVGRSTDKIGFYGTTITTRQVVAATTTTTATTTALQTDLDAVRNALVALGLFTLT